MAAQQGEQAEVAAARFVPVRDQCGQIGTVLEEPLQAPFEVRKSVEEFGLQDLDGVKR
jgi:hypothetical protein